MNKAQRVSNKKNAESLYQKARTIRLNKHTCENCGQPGSLVLWVRGHSSALPEETEAMFDRIEALLDEAIKKALA